jgi:hypothetical protein
MMITRICSIYLLYITLYFYFPIIVLHQLAIRANFDPHAVTQTQHPANLILLTVIHSQSQKKAS